MLVGLGGLVVTPLASLPSFAMPSMSVIFLYSLVATLLFMVAGPAPLLVTPWLAHICAASHMGVLKVGGGGGSQGMQRPPGGTVQGMGGWFSSTLWQVSGHDRPLLGYVLGLFSYMGCWILLLSFPHCSHSAVVDVTAVVVAAGVSSLHLVVVCCRVPGFQDWAVSM